LRPTPARKAFFSSREKPEQRDTVNVRGAG
jgi:hypothetical protein